MHASIKRSSKKISRKKSLPNTKHPSIRKAPGAPKRFMSSYFHFYIDYHKRIKNSIANTQDGKHDCIAVSKTATEVWKTLAPAQRQYWDRKSEEDKKRFFSEKDQYEGPWKVETSNISKKKARKDPSAPKRNPSAFLLFSKNRRTELRIENPQIANNVISVLLGQEWRNMSLAEKMPFKEDEERERAIYKQRMAQWKASQTESHADQEHSAVDDALSSPDSSMDLLDFTFPLPHDLQDNAEFPEVGIDHLTDIVTTDEDCDDKSWGDKIDMVLKNVTNGGDSIQEESDMIGHDVLIASDSEDEVSRLNNEEDYFLNDPLLPLCNSKDTPEAPITTNASILKGNKPGDFMSHTIDAISDHNTSTSLPVNVLPPPALLAWTPLLAWTRQNHVKDTTNTVRLPSFLQRPSQV